MADPADGPLPPRFVAPARAIVRAAKERFGTATSPVRGLPGFVIVGGQRCGTTTLYRALIEHPAIVAATRKEVHFFDLNFARGLGWYRGHFPSTAYLRAVARRVGGTTVTGEASPYYLFHPRAPFRLADSLPDAKLVVMLRDPVSRLISHYHHEVALGHEDLPFERAIASEPSRLAGEEERILRDPRYRSFEHQHHSYVARGRYADQLERWFSVVPRARFHIVESGRFFDDPSGELGRVLAFLGLEALRERRVEANVATAHPPIEASSRAELYDRYDAENQRLYSLLGEDLGWKMGA